MFLTKNDLTEFFTKEELADIIESQLNCTDFEKDYSLKSLKSRLYSAMNDKLSLLNHKSNDFSAKAVNALCEGNFDDYEKYMIKAEKLEQKYIRLHSIFSECLT